MGRESKFTPERRVQILEDIAGGMSQKGAAERAGVTDRTLRYWLRKGRGPAADADFVSFFSAFKKAERDGEESAIKGLIAIGHGGLVVERTTRTDRNGNDIVTEKFSQPQWTALAWWLERKFPVEWGKDNEYLGKLVAELKKRQKAAAYG